MKRVVPISLLEHAIEHDNMAQLDALLQPDVELNAHYPEVEWGTPLLLSAQIGIKETVQLLLDKGADMTVLSPQGTNVLVAAMLVENMETFVCFLENGAVKKLREQELAIAFFWAIYNNLVAYVRLLLDHGVSANVRYENITAFKIAYRTQNNKALLRTLVHAGAHIDPEKVAEISQLFASDRLPCTHPQIVKFRKKARKIERKKQQRAAERIKQERTRVVVTMDVETVAVTTQRVSAAGECVVCMDGPKTHIIIPCGHYCVCAMCTKLIDSCPVCRSHAASLIKVYEV